MALKNTNKLKSQKGVDKHKMSIKSTPQFNLKQNVSVTINFLKLKESRALTTSFFNTFHVFTVLEGNELKAVAVLKYGLQTRWE